MQHAKGHPGLRPSEYMMQLDGLRACAVLAVMYWHWLSNDQMNFPFGGGVQMFFVLSGFLITGILIRCRDGSKTNGDRLAALKIFVIRRVVRIFPLYYVVLLAAAAWGMWPVRESLWWHLAYLTNFYFFHVEEYRGVLTHFWSLAIEEQFYLFWPWLVLFLKPRHLRRVIPSLIGLSIVWRFFGAATGMIPLYEVVTWANFDALGLGAWLAVVRGSREETATIRRISLVAMIPFVISQVIVYAGVDHPLNMAVRHEAMVFSCVWFVSAAAEGLPGWGGRILAWRPMVYLGKISYGLYVFHYFAGPVIHGASRRFAPVVYDNIMLRILTMFVFTLAISAISWKFMEKPLNDQKSRFPYPKPGSWRKDD